MLKQAREQSEAHWGNREAPGRTTRCLVLVHAHHGSRLPQCQPGWTVHISNNVSKGHCMRQPWPQGTTTCQEAASQQPLHILQHAATILQADL